MKGKRLVMFLALVGGAQYCSGHQPPEPSLVEIVHDDTSKSHNSSHILSRQKHTSGQKKSEGFLNRVKSWFSRGSGAHK